jgi:hypothetical protein
MKVRVFHFNRVAMCDHRLVAFFSWWNIHGPFPITIPANGGLRTDELEQARFFAEGHSKAKTLDQTPHGRGGAVDAYPAILDPTGAYVAGIRIDPKDPQTKVLFTQYGSLAETHGLVWGGRWKFVDMPHVETPDWRDSPFPPNKE